MALTSASALMVALSFPPMGWWGLTLLAWSPFFMVIRELEPKLALGFGFLHGFLSFSMTLSWFWNIFSVAAVALWLLLALFPALWAYLHASLRKRCRMAHIPLGAALFVALEYFRGELFVLSFPWITPGTGLPPNLITSVIGTYGVSFLVVLSNLFLIEPGKRTELTGLGIAVGILTAILMTPEQSPETSEPIKVALVQGDELSLESRYARSSTLPGLVDIIVWPEYALPDDPHLHPEVTTQISTLLQKRAKTLIAGGPLWHDLKDESWSNTAFTFTPSGLDHWQFKLYPVHFFDDGDPGTEISTIDIGLGKIGTPVGSDSEYQGVIRKMVADGAELLLVPTMNRKDWSRKQHLQQAAHLRHRAAENRRWIAQASTSGVTQIIDPYGNVTSRLALNKKATLMGQLYLDQRTTFFQKGGWLFGPGAFLISLIAVPLIFFKTSRRSQKKKMNSETDQTPQKSTSTNSATP